MENKQSMQEDNQSILVDEPKADELETLEQSQSTQLEETAQKLEELDQPPAQVDQTHVEATEEKPQNKEDFEQETNQTEAESLQTEQTEPEEKKDTSMLNDTHLTFGPTSQSADPTVEELPQEQEKRSDSHEEPVEAPEQTQPLEVPQQTQLLPSNVLEIEKDKEPIESVPLLNDQSEASLTSSDQPASKQGLTANQKKKLRKQAKKQKKMGIREFYDRHVSHEEYDKIKEMKNHADIEFRNHNQMHKWQQCKKSDNLSQDQTSEDSEDDSDEDFEDFHVDGYHPCHINEVIDGRYVILKKLGWGHFSTVWLALHLQDKQLYALKFQKSAEKYTQSAVEEEEILYDVASNFKHPKWEKLVRKYYKNPKLEVDRKHTHNLQMFDQFFHHSQNGKHSVMAFEVLGKNLLHLIKKHDYRGVPMPVVREIARQTLISLDYLHRICGIIHTDLKPENVVFSLNEAEKFDMICTNVLNTPLVDLFETSGSIILNKRQSQNQKKRDRKKKKALEKKGENSTAEGSQAVENEEEEKKEPEIKDKKSNIVVQQYWEKVMKQDKEFKAQYTVQDKVRAQSTPRSKGGEYMKWKILEEPETVRLGYVAYEHPPRAYAKYIKRHAKTNFSELRILSAGDAKTFKKLVRRERPNTHFRIRSESPQKSRIAKMNEDLTPKDKENLHQIQRRNFEIKMCDMGNACYINKHYSDVIQTREYRSPEVILEGEYDETADMWSLATMIFELVTGDYLFDPCKGKTFKKNDDHLGQISELIGECNDKKWLETCDGHEDFYNNKNKLKRINKLKLWPLKNVLLEKYRMKESEASSLASFLGAMLKWNPNHRSSAKEMLEHQWLKMAPKYNTYMPKDEAREWKKLHRPDEASSSSSSEEHDQSSSDRREEEGESSSGEYETEEEESVNTTSDENKDDEAQRIAFAANSTLFNETVAMGDTRAADLHQIVPQESMTTFPEEAMVEPEQRKKMNNSKQSGKLTRTQQVPSQDDNQDSLTSTKQDSKQEDNQINRNKSQ